MGEVKEAVKGSGSKTKTGAYDKNLLEQVKDLYSKICELAAKKDDDVFNEGDAAKPDNIRKAAHLRAAASMLSATIALLEDY